MCIVGIYKYTHFLTHNYAMVLWYRLLSDHTDVHRQINRAPTICNINLLYGISISCFLFIHPTILRYGRVCPYYEANSRAYSDWNILVDCLCFVDARKRLGTNTKVIVIAYHFSGHQHHHHHH